MTKEDIQTASRQNGASCSAFQILHRAKMKDTAFWFFGYYTGCEFFVVENEQGIVEIDENTVGVFIQKKCRKTNENLFTGDLVICDDKHIYLVVFDDFNCRFALKSSPSSSGLSKIGQCEKVGNIFDNSELFIEPEQTKETPSRTRSSDAFSNRNTKEALRQVGLR